MPSAPVSHVLGASVRMFHVKHRFVLFRVKAFSRGVVRKVRLGMAGAMVYSEMDTLVKREGAAC